MLRALLAAAGIGVAAWLADRGARPFRWPRRWIWHAAMVVSALLPFLASVMPHVAMVDALVGHVMLAATPLSAPVTGSHLLVLGASIDALLGGVWIVSSALALAVFLTTQLRLRAARASWVRARIDGVAVLVAPDAGPAVVGIVAPTIVLPAWVIGAPDEERRLITAHEQAHAQAGDARLLAWAALMVALMPWNVVLWWQHRRLRCAVEIDCDARILALGADVRRYSHMLVTAASRPRSLSLGPALTDRHAFLTSRILAMTVPAPVRLRYPRAVLCGLATIVAVAVACDAVGSRLPSAPSAATVTSFQKLFLSCAANDGQAAAELGGGLVIHVTGASHPDWTCAVPDGIKFNPDGMQLSVVTTSGLTRTIKVTSDMPLSKALERIVELQKGKSTATP